MTRSLLVAALVHCGSHVGTDRVASHLGVLSGRLLAEYSFADKARVHDEEGAFSAVIFSNRSTGAGPCGATCRTTG
jgi:hypothetical protein